MDHARWHRPPRRDHADRTAANSDDGGLTLYAPAWNDDELSAGVMVRGALWLVQEIGLGNAFTKEDIRRAFPGVAQADRRIRDLRDYGWVLHTSKEDASLTIEQTRFVATGAAVWDAHDRRAANQNKGITSKERDAVLSRDDYMCTVCGVSGAEEYPDDATQTAVLGVSTRVTVMPDGHETALLVTECKRCKAGLGRSRRSAEAVTADVRALSGEDRGRLTRWMRSGKRDLADAERVWSRYLRLPPEAREAVRTALDG